MTTAALTHACQMVEIMAFYLDVNLPKRIDYRWAWISPLLLFFSVLYSPFLLSSLLISFRFSPFFSLTLSPQLLSLHIDASRTVKFIQKLLRSFVCCC